MVAQVPLLTQQFFTRASPAAGRNVEWAAIKSFEYVQSSGGLTKISGQSITGTATSDGHVDGDKVKTGPCKNRYR